MEANEQLADNETTSISSLFADPYPTPPRLHQSTHHQTTAPTLVSTQPHLGQPSSRATPIPTALKPQLKLSPGEQLQLPTTKRAKAKKLASFADSTTGGTPTTGSQLATSSTRLTAKVDLPFLDRPTCLDDTPNYTPDDDQDSPFFVPSPTPPQQQAKSYSAATAKAVGPPKANPPPAPKDLPDDDDDSYENGPVEVVSR